MKHLRSITTVLAFGLSLGTGVAHANPSALTRLDVKFNQTFAETACPAGSPSNSFCLLVTGVGHAHHLGHVSFTRTVVIGGALVNDCVPATTTGTLTVHGGDHLQFSGAGSFCLGSQTAAYSFTVSGGTGQLAGATGNGTITVPPAETDTTGDEIWTGFLAPSP